jgi:hypothetical protein
MVVGNKIKNITASIEPKQKASLHTFFFFFFRACFQARQPDQQHSEDSVLLSVSRTSFLS